MTLVLVVVCAVMTAAAAALVVDVGQLCAVRVDLQRAADSSALSGASGLISNELLSGDVTSLQSLVSQRSQDCSGPNGSYRSPGTLLGNSDIEVGWQDLDDMDSPLETIGGMRPNAVRITTHRSSSSPNGAVAFFFAQLLGMPEGNVSASAQAIFDDRVGSIDFASGISPLIPFTIDRTFHDSMVSGGDDEFTYQGDEVAEESDGIPEVKIYPWKLKKKNGEDYFEPDGAGNFGLLSFGGGGTAAAVEQITNGITPEEIESTMGTTNLAFYDEIGNSISYTNPGAPGIHSSMQGAIQAREGDVVGYFIHDTFVDVGGNLEFQTVGVRYGRVMSASFGGSTKAFVIQPVAFTGPGIRINVHAAPTGGLLGRLVLVK